MPQSTFSPIGIALKTEQRAALSNLPSPVTISGLVRTLVRLYLEGALGEAVQEAIISDALNTEKAVRSTQFKPRKSISCQSQMKESLRFKLQSQNQNLPPQIQSLEMEAQSEPQP